jgi:hypothetical protein
MSKYPSKKELTRIIKSIKKTICDDYRAFEEDDIPGIQLTVGHNPETRKWDYQTGDNSYSGAAYFYPNWAVVGVYRRSNSEQLASDIINQLKDLSVY